MKFSKLLVAFTCTLWVQACFCRVFSSTFKLLELLKTERKIIEGLTGYFERQEKHGVKFETSITEFVNKADQLNEEDTTSIEKNGTPLLVFQILYRAVQEWEKFYEHLTCEEEDEKKCPILTGADVIDVTKRREGSQWPSEVDLKQAARTIVDVCNVYDLDLKNIVKGSIGSVTERPLSADHIFFIGNAARDAGMTYEAVTWFKFLLERLDTLGPHMFKVSSLYRRLALTYREYGMGSKAIELLQKYLEIEPDDKGVSRDLEYLQTTGAADDVTEFVRFKANDTSKATVTRQQYERLCKFTAKIRKSGSSRLHCFLVTLFNSYGTVKVELLSRQPRIEVLYNVVNENETEEILSYGEKAFSEFYEMHSFKLGTTAADHRIQSGAMCEWDTRYPLLYNITHRLEQMTRFHMYPEGEFMSSECYTLTNEGPGYISQPAVDFFPDGYRPFPFAGNRLATIMIQLSDVNYGGSVVFPKLNVTVPVTRGSAVIWWNLKRDGSPSQRSAHAHCPTVIGSNWALFKNILSDNQLFRRPCEPVKKQS